LNRAVICHCIGYIDICKYPHTAISIHIISKARRSFFSFCAFSSDSDSDIG
jgi:hypothetical protein